MLQLLSYHLCAVEKTFATKLLMHMLFAIMITNVSTRKEGKEKERMLFILIKYFMYNGYYFVYTSDGDLLNSVLLI